MQPLNPTLWRTCKMLAGKTRIRLLRQLHAPVELSVSALGRRVGIREPAASQELRRIQSRGLLQAERRGQHVIYRMAADAQVATAGPLLKAIRSAFACFPHERDEDMCVIAAGLSNERRIQILRALRKDHATLHDVRRDLKIPSYPFAMHLNILQASGFVVRTENRLHLAVPDHPLAKALAKLLQQGVAR